MSVQITWHGHSCFTVSAEEYDIVLDPYEPESVPGLAPLDLFADEVLCSHYHHDHGCEWVVQLAVEPGESPFTVKTIKTFHDPERGALRGENTIHLLQAGNIKVAHFGDLGCALTPEQKKQLSNLDAIMIPVGGYFTIDAKEAREIVKELNPRVVIPMHYRSEEFGYEVIGRLAEYTRLTDDVVNYDTNTIEISKKTPAQTAVLKYIGE